MAPAAAMPRLHPRRSTRRSAVCRSSSAASDTNTRMLSNTARKNHRRRRGRSRRPAFRINVHSAAGDWLTRCRPPGDNMEIWPDRGRRRR